MSEDLDHIETVVTCLEDDAARLLDQNDGDEIAHNMVEAAKLLRELTPQPREADGWAYGYPNPFGDGTTIRFNGAEEVNGERPIEALPFWFRRPPFGYAVLFESAASGMLYQIRKAAGDVSAIFINGERFEVRKK